ncbi:MAG: hypothetical protein ACXADF_07120 [Candidatus Thorarchaeota archaeon]|jgi:hypothetical protein
MKNLKISGPVMITEGSHELISIEKALVNLQEGCAWITVVNNGDPVGIAFIGSGRLAVDAILALKEYSSFLVKRRLRDYREKPLILSWLI